MTYDPMKPVSKLRAETVLASFLCLLGHCGVRIDSGHKSHVSPIWGGVPPGGPPDIPLLIL